MPPKTPAAELFFQTIGDRIRADETTGPDQYPLSAQHPHADHHRLISQLILAIDKRSSKPGFKLSNTRNYRRISHFQDEALVEFILALTDRISFLQSSRATDSDVSYQHLHQALMRLLQRPLPWRDDQLRRLLAWQQSHADFSANTALLQKVLLCIERFAKHSGLSTDCAQSLHRLLDRLPINTTNHKFIRRLSLIHI